MSTWYYADGDHRKGPISSETLNELVAAGKVNDDTLVWRDGLAEWQPWGTLRGEAGITPASGSAPEDDGTELCAESGLRLPRSRMVQVGDQWVSVEHRDEYFQKLREGGHVGQGLRPARIMARVAARFVDGMIMFALFFFAGIILAIAGGSDETGTLLPLTLLFLNVAQWVIPALYTAFFLSRRGATPGKMVVKIKVVRPDGGPLSFWRAFGRHFADMLSAMILLIGYLIALGDPERRTLHDRICDTRVVEQDD